MTLQGVILVTLSMIILVGSISLSAGLIVLINRRPVDRSGRH